MLGIMLVDDESAVMNGLAEMIDWQTLDTEIVARATSGQEALAYLELAPMDILITDICMPQMDGLALIAAAKRLNPMLRCIVISAHDEFEYARKALSLGVENYLLKPINANELYETLLKTVANIEHAAASAPNDELAFRANILDRWANNSIQDLELAERAQLLGINLFAKEYQAAVISPQRSGIAERLAQSLRLLKPLRMALSGVPCVDSFVDRHANLAIIAYGDNMGQTQQTIARCLGPLLEPARCFASFGSIAGSAYALGVSYRNAYLLLPYRHLAGGSAAFCGEHPAMLETSTAVLRFEQALEELDAKAAREAAMSLLQEQRTPARSPAETLLPLILRMLLQFDDSKSRHGAVPDALLGFLRTLQSVTEKLAPTAMEAAIHAAAIALADRRSTMHPVIRRALDIVSATYTANINIKTTADQLNINPGYFGRLFKAETGQQFSDHLTAVRLRAARSLLTETDLRICEIIRRIGISRQSYFNRLFKKEYGVTPVEFRRMVAEGSPLD